MTLSIMPVQATYYVDKPPLSAKQSPPLLKRILRRLLSKSVVKHCISFQIEYWFLTLMVWALLVITSYSLMLPTADSLKAKVYLEMP